MEAKVQKVLTKLQWMREKKIWPNGLRYLWTDAHGVCALLTLYYELKVIYFKNNNNTTNKTKRNIFIPICNGMKAMWRKTHEQFQVPSDDIDTFGIAK